MNYALYIIFGILPTIIWLLFYLRKDAHPESNRMIITVFLCGMAIAPLAALLECFPTSLTKLNCFLPSFFLKTFFYPFNLFLYYLLGVALVEEFVKYLVVRLVVLKHHELDEPLDVMLYMIIAALGFAAIENILYLFPIKDPQFFSFLFKISFFTAVRSIGAIFLHTLCSGILGYFMAKSFYDLKQKWKLLFKGFFWATALHAFFNFFIIKAGEGLKEINGRLVVENYQLFVSSIVILCVILIGLAVFTTFGFRNLKKMKGVCKII